MSLKDIIQGHLNEVRKTNEELSQERLAICEECPIFNKISDNLGGLCSSKYYLNPETNDISSVHKMGYFKGCGCRLNAKTRLSHSKCPAGKW